MTAPPDPTGTIDGGPSPAAARLDDPRQGPQCGAKPAAHDPQESASLLDEIAPPPPSIGADVPATYFGPPPSSVNPNFVGPLTLLRSGVIDFEKGTIKLPLYKGRVKTTGKTLYYILTDTSDKGIADALGLNFSAKLEVRQRAAGRAAGAHARRSHAWSSTTGRSTSPGRTACHGRRGSQLLPAHRVRGRLRRRQRLHAHRVRAGSGRRLRRAGRCLWSPPTRTSTSVRAIRTTQGARQGHRHLPRGRNGHVAADDRLQLRQARLVPQHRRERSPSRRRSRARPSPRPCRTRALEVTTARSARSSASSRG